MKPIIVTEEDVKNFLDQDLMISRQGSERLAYNPWLKTYIVTFGGERKDASNLTLALSWFNYGFDYQPEEEMKSE